MNYIYMKRLAPIHYQKPAPPREPPPTARCRPPRPDPPRRRRSIGSLKTAGTPGHPITCGLSKCRETTGGGGGGMEIGLTCSVMKLFIWIEPRNIEFSRTGFPGTSAADAWAELLHIIPNLNLNLMLSIRCIFLWNIIWICINIV